MLKNIIAQHAALDCLYGYTITANILDVHHFCAHFSKIQPDMFWYLWKLWDLH